MPRVITATKNHAGKARNCGRCGEPIIPGEKYRKWSFRYGGTHFRCGRTSCNPRPSELTQSKLSTVYAAQEDAHDTIGAATTVEDITGAVEAVAEAAREVADEYQEADEAFGGTGATEHAERASEMEGFAEELESWMPSTEGYDEDDPPDHVVDAVREEAQEAIDNCPL